MTVTIYETATGRILRTYSGPSPQEQIADGESLYEGELPLLGCRIENGQPLEVVPPAPSFDLEWDADYRRFKLTASAQLRLDTQRQIDDLERQQLRSMRELTLSRGSQADARKKLEDIDDKIAALRMSLPT